MRPIALLFLLLILAPLAAFAQSAQMLPASPNAADRLTLQLTSDIRCPTIAPGGLRMEGQVITVEVVPSCFLAFAPYTGRVSIGRLPAGSYRINVLGSQQGSAQPQALASLEFTVGPFPELMHVTEDLSGHWLTETPGEGVTITQSGKRAFIVIATYDAAGNQRWLVIPDARLDLEPMTVDGPAMLRGTMYETRGFPTTGLSSAIEVGVAQVLLPTFGPDRLTLLLSGPGQVRQVALRRLIF